MVSYFTGLTTVVETAALAVVYTMLLTLFKKEMTLNLLTRVLRRGIPVIGGVLVILAMAKGLSYYIVDAQVPTMLTAFFRDHISSRFVFLILLNLALLLTGTLMDIYSAILVVAPLIIPLGVLYDVHPVQLGIIFLANLQLGYLTPPVGMNLFLASYTFEEPMSRIYRQVIPFLLVLIVAVLLITYVPWFSLALLG
jgi:tripartite ATP-independent transporter DctM subunit